MNFPNDPVGTIRISPDEGCVAVRGFYDDEPSWYMIEVEPVPSPDEDSYQVGVNWPVIWPR